MLDDGCSGIKRERESKRKTAAKNSEAKFRLKNAIFSVNKYFPPCKSSKKRKKQIFIVIAPPFI
jgi:hypothetical protein